MLSETSQAQRDKHHVIPLNEEPRVVNETGSRTTVARGWGRDMGLFDG